jgi:hypothetical protein
MSQLLTGGPTFDTLSARIYQAALSTRGPRLVLLLYTFPTKLNEFDISFEIFVAVILGYVFRISHRVFLYENAYVSQEPAASIFMIKVCRMGSLQLLTLWTVSISLFFI